MLAHASPHASPTRYLTQPPCRCKLELPAVKMVPRHPCAQVAFDSLHSSLESELGRTAVCTVSSIALYDLSTRLRRYTDARAAESCRHDVDEVLPWYNCHKCDRWCIWLIGIMNLYTRKSSSHQRPSRKCVCSQSHQTPPHLCHKVLIKPRLHIYIFWKT